AIRRASAAVTERPGGKQETALLEADHVFQMRRQKRLQLLRSRRGKREYGIKLPPQHLLRQFGNALLEVHNVPLLIDPLTSSSAAAARRVNTRFLFQSIMSGPGLPPRIETPKLRPTISN